MPAADLLSSALLHVLPVELLLLAAAVLAQRHPTHHLLALHAAAAVDGDEQRDVRQLEERHLEDEGLLVDGVGLAAPHRRLAARDLLAHRVQQRQPAEGVWRAERVGGAGFKMSKTFCTGNQCTGPDVKYVCVCVCCWGSSTDLAACSGPGS